MGSSRDGSPPDALPDSWQVAVRSVPMTGSISRVLVQLPHVFQRMQVESLASVIDARYPHPPPFPLDPGSHTAFIWPFKLRIGLHVGFIDDCLPDEMR